MTNEVEKTTEKQIEEEEKEVKKVSKKLKSLRKEKNLSQKELAKIMGISQGSYSKYERGIISLSEDAFISLVNKLKDIPSNTNTQKAVKKAKRTKRASIAQKIRDKKNTRKETNEKETNFICPFLKEKEEELAKLKELINEMKNKLQTII